MNLASGQYFGFKPTGSELWNAIVGGQNLTECVHDKGMAIIAVAFENWLMELGLIAPNTQDIQVHSALISFAGAPSIEVYEVYDVLSDLIIADPIYDVDAKNGWPHMPVSGT